MFFSPSLSLLQRPYLGGLGSRALRPALLRVAQHRRGSKLRGRERRCSGCSLLECVNRRMNDVIALTSPDPASTAVDACICGRRVPGRWR